MGSVGEEGEKGGLYQQTTPLTAIVADALTKVISLPPGRQALFANPATHNAGLGVGGIPGSTLVGLSACP